MIDRILSLVVACLLVAGCNTMQGLGKDIQKGGEKIEKAAERHK